MSAGMYLLGIVLTIISIISFQQGGVWIIGGAVSLIGILYFGFLFLKEDTIKNKKRRKGKENDF